MIQPLPASTLAVLLMARALASANDDPRPTVVPQDPDVSAARARIAAKDRRGGAHEAKEHLAIERYQQTKK